ncbi:MAG: DegV family protein [Spirochaetales bacterium]
MKQVIISSDSCLDEFKSVLVENNVSYIPMLYILDKEYRDNFDSQEDYDNFYAKMKDGAMPTTSMLNAFEVEEYFEKLIKQYDCDIVHISLSSALSGTYDNSNQAAESVMQKYKDNKIYVVDSLSATQGQNILVKYAVQERNKGKTAQGIFNELQEIKHKIQHWFLISDLFHLRRGGRISGAKAVIGTVLQTKPILTINNEGKLDIVAKAIGTKKAIKILVDKLEEMGLENIEQDVYIAQANCLEDAELLKKFTQKHFHKVNVIIKNIGPVIGSHTGPDTLGIVFLGKDRVKAK